MFKLILLTVLGCGPAELEVATDDSGEQLPQLPPIEYGIAVAEDCSHDQIGATVCDFKFDDHTGNPWRLYEHEGKVVILDFSAAWCGPCQSAGHYAQPIQDDYAGEVVIVTLLMAGIENLPTTQEDVQTWAEAHGNTSSPVLQAPAGQVMDPSGVTGYDVQGYPTYIYLARDLSIYLGHTGFSEEYMRTTIDGML
jgi:thiol-disulfide isomerase/thioredoxin